MPVIRAGEATKPKTPPKTPVYPIHPATGDIQQAIRWDNESFRLHTNTYRFWILQIEESKPDDLYGEPTVIESGGKVYRPVPVYVNAYVYWESSSKMLEKVGIVSERDIVVEFSIAMLAAMTSEVPPDGLYPKSGDVIVIDSSEYILEEVHRGQPWYGNIQFPIHVYAPCTRRKLSNITDDRADESESTGPEHPVSEGPTYPSKPDNLYGD